MKIAHKQAERSLDLYPSPTCATEALLRAESLPSLVWEPAAGRGAIAKVLRDAGHTVICSDIVERCDPIDFVGDFLKQNVPPGVACIVSNPPYDRTIINPFVTHALDICPRVMMLLRLSFLESAGRTEIRERSGLARVHVFKERLQGMHRDGWTGKKAKGSVAYAWFAWERGHTGPPVINRISIYPPGNERAGTKPLTSPKRNLTMATKKSTKAAAVEENVVPLNIVKPKKSVFERFSAKKKPTISGVAEQLGALHTQKLSEANDFVRLSPNPEHWSPEMCFVAVPIHGEKRDLVHFIEEELAATRLPSKKLLRYRLALASKPYDVFFLAIIPTTNLDNSWNSSMLAACERAKTHWVQVTSRKAEGKDSYKVDCAEDQDAFPEPNWPDDMASLIEATYEGRMIEDMDHPAWARLIGRKQDLK